MGFLLLFDFASACDVRTQKKGRNDILEPNGRMYVDETEMSALMYFAHTERHFLRSVSFSLSLATFIHFVVVDAMIAFCVQTTSHIFNSFIDAVVPFLLITNRVCGDGTKDSQKSN